MTRNIIMFSPRVTTRASRFFIKRNTIPKSVSQLSIRSIASFKVVEDRLWNTLQDTATIAGASSAGGLVRLSCSNEDKIARDWFADQVKALDCEYSYDAMGIQRALVPGINNSIPPIGFGSHLDSVQRGGKFDGPLGVLAGLEILKLLKENNHKTYAPLTLINWTNEEGARFPPGCMSSAVWAGKLDIDFAHNCRDTVDPNTSIGSELKRIGYLGTKEVSYKTSPLSAHFELHIEQGPRLEKAGLEVGVVTGSQGMRWFNVVLKGETRHTDTTIMAGRKDALVGAAKAVLNIQQIGKESGGMATVSLFKSSPQNFCNIPGEVSFSFSMQHPDLEVLKGMESEAEKYVREVVAKEDGLEVVSWENVWSFDPAPFDEVAVGCVESSAKEQGLKYMRLMNHTGHDSIYTKEICPTAMVFARCKDGISHSPKEYSSPADCAAGTQTLMGAILRYDDILRKKHEG